MGPGLAWGDADGDGWVDLYQVQGGGREGSEASTNRLLRNLEGRFVDVTAASGGGDRGAGMGALFFDAEGDADLDLIVANYGADVLYENRPAPQADPGAFGARLVDVSAAAGVGGDRWSAGVAAGDADLDGDLDLYITSYLVYDPALMPPAEELGRYRREDPIEMLPFAFPGQENLYLRNESGAEGPRFVDATDELKLADRAGRGMQPVFWDFDRDGDDDLYVANDVSYNVLWRNEQGRRFRDVSFATGMDDPRGGMGVAVGDADLDGDEDLFLTNWQLEPNALYLNNLVSHRSTKHRVATFRDGIVASGMGPSGVGATSWGAEWLDLENDGDLDLFVANGYTSPDYESTGICVGQANHLFENDGQGRFVEAAARAGGDLLRPPGLALRRGLRLRPRRRPGPGGERQQRPLPAPAQRAGGRVQGPLADGAPGRIGPQSLRGRGRGQRGRPGPPVATQPAGRHQLPGGQPARAALRPGRGRGSPGGHRALALGEGDHPPGAGRGPNRDPAGGRLAGARSRHLGFQVHVGRVGHAVDVVEVGDDLDRVVDRGVVQAQGPQGIEVGLGHVRRREGELLGVGAQAAVDVRELGAAPVLDQGRDAGLPHVGVEILELRPEVHRVGVDSVVATVGRADHHRQHLALGAGELAAPEHRAAVEPHGGVQGARVEGSSP